MTTEFQVNALYMTADEFIAAYPVRPNGLSVAVASEALGNAMSNTTSALSGVPSRVIIGNLLLDWGADPTHVSISEISLSKMGTKLGHNVINSFMYYLEDPVAEAPLLRRLLEAGADPNLRDGKMGVPLEFLADNTPTVGRPLEDDQLAPIYDILFSRPDLDFASPNELGYDPLFLLRGHLWTHPDLVRRVETYVFEHTGALPPDPRLAVEDFLGQDILTHAVVEGTPITSEPRAPKGPQYDAQFCLNVEEFFNLHPELVRGGRARPKRRALSQALTGALWNRIAEPDARIDLISALLDRGADPNDGGGSRFAHSAASLHDVARGLAGRNLALEAVAIKKLVDAGANLNQYDSDDGTPLETIVATAAAENIPEDELAAIYDVIFAVHGLDFSATDEHGNNTLSRLHSLAATHPILAGRLASYFGQ